jgi:hypothetical protein
MTTNHLKTGDEPAPETSCISNIPQTMDSVQHSVSITAVFRSFEKFKGKAVHEMSRRGTYLKG